jgi:hypothetical protein
MSLRIVRAASEAEQSDDLHVGRLLILLRTASGKRQTKVVEGIMKLAKMDFLLRYPNCLERIVRNTGGNVAAAKVQPFERNTIESKMIRFRYGPWDGRYRRWIGILVAKGLAITFVKGNTVNVGLTPRGHAIAAQIEDLPDFEDVQVRSQLIYEAVGGMSATRLRNFVYAEFPELLDMRWGEEIEL